MISPGFIKIVSIVPVNGRIVKTANLGNPEIDKTFGWKLSRWWGEWLAESGNNILSNLSAGD